MIKIKWKSIPPVEIREIEKIVIEDIERNLSSVDQPSNLIFHHIFLTEDYKGPCVLVWGEEGDDEYFHCEYHFATEWQTAEEEKFDI